MTTITMSSLWVEWNAAHTAIVDYGTADLRWIGDHSLSYSYQAGWSGGTAPVVDLLKQPSAVQFAFGDGSVRQITNITDGTSNTIFFGETTSTGPFSGYVMGITDVALHRDYYVGLDGHLPSFAPGNPATILPFIEDLTSGAGQITGGNFSPGDPIILDGTSNTILISENDTLNGDAAAQTWYGGRGRDAMHGNGGADWLEGGAARDRVFGGAAADTVLGGADPDRVDGGGGNDQCYGGLGGDTVLGGDGTDRLFGGDPYVRDLTGADRLYGGRGDDSLYGGNGADLLAGGAGNDGIYCGGGPDSIQFGFGGGHDDVWDFSIADGDVVHLGHTLLAGETTAQQVYDHYATLLGDGSVRFLFNGGEVLMLHGVGAGNLLGQLVLD